MSAWACVTTARTPAAIAGIHLKGSESAGVLCKLLRTNSGKPLVFESGELKVATLVDGSKIIDQVVVACFGADQFDINCHGNPLLVAAAMRLLAGCGVRVISAAQMLLDRYQSAGSTIALEAKLEQLKARTLEGAKMIAQQADSGLTRAVRRWSDQSRPVPLAEIKRECGEILSRSRNAELVIRGCRIVICGPPNSGKSTLLNALTRRNQAIVSDVPGTTRDWISAHCRIGPLAAEFIDTAGLDPAIVSEAADQTAQAAALRLLGECDLAIHVIDVNRPGPIRPLATGAPVIVVLNKSDLAAKVTADELTFRPAACVHVSALHAVDLEAIPRTVRTVLGVDTFNADDPICFTPRQTALLVKLARATEETIADSLIRQLLSAPLSL